MHAARLALTITCTRRSPRFRPSSDSILALSYLSNVPDISNVSPIRRTAAMSPKSGVDIPPLQGASRPSSAPPSTDPASPNEQTFGSSPTASSIPPLVAHRMLSETLAQNHRRTHSQTPPNETQSLDLMPQLLRSGPSVVKSRTGSVLTRGFVLKTDYWPSGALTVYSTHDITS